MNKTSSGASIAAAVLLACSGLVPAQQSFAQTVTNQAVDTNVADTVACNTSAPTRRGYYLTMDGVDGANGSPCYFEIKDFSFGVENPTTIGSATGGAGAGKVKFNEFTIKKTSDRASPSFFKNCVAGAHYKKVVLIVRKAGSTQTDYLIISDAMISSARVAWSGPGDEGPEESITFVYDNVAIQYNPQGNPQGRQP